MLSKKAFEVPSYLLELTRSLPVVKAAVVGADHPVALESALRALDAQAIEPILIGNEEVIRSLAFKAGRDLFNIKIIPETEENKMANTAAALAQSGEVEVVMKGHIHTDTLMRAILRREFNLRTDRRVSHVFHMTFPGKEGVLYVTDAVVNITPDISDTVDIINNAVSLAHALGNAQPNVALLSATEIPNPKMPSSIQASEVAIQAANGRVNGAVVDGPFGLDNAISKEAAALKGIDSPVAGKADILVVPNIESGNILFKQMVYFLSATAAGIVMGTKIPIVLTSRADPPEARLAAALISVIFANNNY